MRKIFILMALFVVIAGTAWAGTIMVSSPRAGEVLCKGRTYSIAWSSSGRIARVMVRLMRGSTVAANLSWSADNSGRFEFAVAASIPEGEYKIAVNDVVDRAQGGESGVFRVNACTVTGVPPAPAEIMPQITVIYPGGPTGGHIHVGGYIPVRWKTIGRMPEVVTISLHPADCSGSGTYLATARTSAGAQYVRIPPSYGGSGVLSIRVGVFGGSLGGCGQMRLVNDFLITNPTLSTVLRQGERFTLRFNRSPGLIGVWIVPETNLTDALGRRPGYAVLFEGSVDGNEQMMNLPTDIPPGRYFIFAGIGYWWGNAGTASDIFQVIAR